MATLIKGPTMSRGSLIGEQVGGAFQQAFQSTFGQGYTDKLAQNKFEPLRASLAGSVGSMAPGPMASLMQSMVSDPSTFATIMQNPGAMSAASAMGGAMTPADPLDEFPEWKEIERLLPAIGAAVESGDTTRASVLSARLQDVAGIEPEATTELVKNIRAMGLDPTNGEGRELMMANMVKARELSQRETRINELTARGLNPQMAADLVDGQAFIDMSDPARPKLVNENTGTVEELAPGASGFIAQTYGQPGEDNTVRPEPAAAPSTVSTEPGNTLYDLAGVATGPAASFRAGVSRFTDLVGLPVASRTQQARQTFNNERYDLIKAFINNPRLPVAEQEWIRKEIDISPGVFTGEQTLQNRMVSIDESLESQIAQYQKNAANASLPKDERDAYATAVADMQDFRAVMGAWRYREGGGEQLPEGIPEGSTVIGYRDGKAVYQDPNGDQWIEE